MFDLVGVISAVTVWATVWVGDGLGDTEPLALEDWSSVGVKQQSLGHFTHFSDDAFM